MNGTAKIRRLFSGSKVPHCPCCERPARWEIGYRGPGGEVARQIGCERLANRLERKWGPVNLAASH